MTAPLSPDEAKWARSLGLLQKEKSCWEENPWKVISCIALVLLIGAFSVVIVFLAGVM